MFTFPTKIFGGGALSKEDADWEANATLWKKFMLTYKYDVVTGVFPPVAIVPLLTELTHLGHGGVGITVLTPVSAQSAEVRADGSRQITFRHLRWQRLFD